MTDETILASTVQAHTDRTAEIVERRVATAAITIQAQFIGITQLIDHRVTANKDQSDTAIEGLEKASTARIQTTKELLLEKMDAMDRARDLQAIEYERRLTQLNHEHQRIESMAHTFVRIDTNEKDWSRARADNERDWAQLRAERAQQDAQAAAAKIVTDTAADTMRRNTMLALASGMIAVLSVAVSIFLHFTPNHL